MIALMRAGGAPIWIVLLFGALTMIAAGYFFFRPDERRLAMLRGLSNATVFAVLTALCANLAAVMFRVPSHLPWSKSPAIGVAVMTGIGEALTPGMLGFTLLALAWLMTALGLRRLPPSK